VNVSITMNNIATSGCDRTRMTSSRPPANRVGRSRAAGAMLDR
jgi:hypothetical protein